MLSLRFLSLAALLGLLGLYVPPAAAQSGDYDPSWYDPEAPHVRIAVTQDGVVRVPAQQLQNALPDGASLAAIDPATLRLLEHGQEIPLQLTGTEDGTLDPADALTFVGHRNRGTDELWAYSGDASRQSSAFRSLYADTTYYWLTWGGADGLRYDTPSVGSGSTVTAVRDTVHDERDRFYYFGRPFENSDATYTESEGYYWFKFRHNGTQPIAFEHRLDVGRRTADGSELQLRVRLDAETNSCHRVAVEAELQQDGGTVAFEPLGEVEWSGFERETFTASVVQERIPDDGLQLRLTSRNDAFSISGCGDPASRPNFVLLDFIEATYTRSLTAQNDVQQFRAPAAQATTFELSGYAEGPVTLYNATDGRRYTATPSGGTASIPAAPSADAELWAVGPNGTRAPAAVLPDASSNWSVPSAHNADYLILTTAALLPSAQRLADYRRSHDGYQVEIARLQDVFDEFDYGRPTPIAIRRFVRATQQWDTAPDFLSIFGDAQFPIVTGDIDEVRPEWSVPSFGFSPSDGWFAMQTGGPNDFSEVLAVGRIPVRSVAQGDLFLDKLQRYESSDLDVWQKRMLLLAGGTSTSEQNRLQFYSNRWGSIMADTTAAVNSETVRIHTGADTLQYYKQSTSALDASFQDSLSADLQRGSGWLNYFGHSAALTWEIVTDPPSEFNNAGKLPIVTSLACRTGSFAGGRFEEKNLPSLGEQLVVGTVDADGTPREGSRNGAIAHFGESALGNLLPSAQINDELVERVFVDTVRVLGEAVRLAKADIARQFRNVSLYEKHLLQYGLLGDPATNIAIPAKPDLHIASDLIAIEPTSPTPSQDLTVSVRVQNHGLIPSDSVDLSLTWERPDGATVQRTRRLPRVRLEERRSFTFSLDQRALGTNTFRVRVDPSNAFDEGDETNNVAERSQVVFGTGVDLIAPTDLGTVSSTSPALTVSVRRQTQTAAPVTVQLDSTADFASPALQEAQIDVEGVRGTWQPSAPLEDGTTYVWRARLADADRTTWRTGRFTVRTDTEGGGWLQKGSLFAGNDNRRLVRENRSWAFDTFPVTVSTNANRGQASSVNAFNVNGTANYEYLQFGFGILVLNGTTGRVRDSESFPTYDLADQFEDDVGDQQDAVDALLTFLDDVAQEGDYVFVRTRHLARRSGTQIPAEVKALLRNLGSDPVASEPHTQAVDTLTYEHVWAMKARKGFPSETVERVSPPAEADEVNEIVLDNRLTLTFPYGETTTPLIGPVSAWSTLRWTATPTSADDRIAVDVLARDSTVLVDDLQDPSGEASLAQIDANAHPFVRLRASLTDSTERVPPQLEQWSVSYTGVPELALDPAALQAAVPDTVEQGETVTVELPVTNLGAVESAPVRVRYTLTDAANVTTTLGVDTLSALAPGEEATSSLELQTADRPGANVLSVTAESDGPTERLSSNNTAVRNFTVRRDQTPPSVDLLVNGRDLPPAPDPISNLQDPRLPFVSAAPSIEILVSDDNPNFRLRDTSVVRVFLKGGLPQRGPTIGSPFRQIPFSSSELQFQPADSDGQNEARVLFDPTFPETDSTYTLKVEAEDAQGNELEPLQATFRVQQDQVVTDVYPYPNPMHTKTTFAFQVKGGTNAMLRDFRLRIYTLSGRLVRELDERHLKRPLSVGWNMLPWNGRDQDGDRVATGVYLYRVRVEGAEDTFDGDVEKSR
jgi:hypothetical protein